jgi:hypothetical protein
MGTTGPKDSHENFASADSQPQMAVKRMIRCDDSQCNPKCCQLTNILVDSAKAL